MNILSRQSTEVSEVQIQDTKEFNAAKYIEIIYNILFFILPFAAIVVFFDPFSVFRSYLVGFVAIVTFFILFLGGYFKKVLYIQRWTNYVPLMILLLGFSISAYFSLNRNVSLFGTTQIYDHSLLFYTSLAVLYFVASNSKIVTSNLLRSLTLGTLISTIFAYLTLFGFNFPAYGKLGGSFNLIGTTTAFLSLLTIIAAYALHDLVQGTKLNVSKVISIMAFVVVTVYVIATMDMLAIVLMSSLFVYILYTDLHLIKQKSILVAGLALVIALFSFVLLYPQTKQALGVQTYQHTPRLAIVESWIISASTLVERPFWGSGLGTYSTVFSAYRPTSYNQYSYWLLRADRAYNPFFTLIATTGLIGLGSIIIFGYFAAKNMIGLNRQNPTHKILLFFIVANLASMLLLGGDLVTWVILFVCLGLVLQNNKTQLSEIKSPAFSMLMVGTIALVSIVFAIKAYGTLAANYYVFRAVNSGNNVGLGLSYLMTAVELDNTEDVYARQFVVIQLQIAKLLSEKKDLTDEDKTMFQDLISNANLIATRLVSRNPGSVANWEVLGLYYDSISGLDKNADASALDAYNNAATREPTNPEHYMSLGRIYSRQKNYQAAVNAFARAVQLKNDYGNAHYSLAFALRELGAYDLAVTEMEIVDRIIPDGTEQDKMIKEQLAEVKKLRDDAIAKNQKQAESDVKLPVQKADEVGQSTEAQVLQDPAEQSDLEINKNEELDVEVPVAPVAPAETKPAETEPAKTETE